MSAAEIYGWPRHVWGVLDSAIGTHACEACGVQVRSVMENGVLERIGLRSGWRRTDEECIGRMEREVVTA